MISLLISGWRLTTLLFASSLHDLRPTSCDSKFLKNVLLSKVDISLADLDAKSVGLNIKHKQQLLRTAIRLADGYNTSTGTTETLQQKQQTPRHFHISTLCCPWKEWFQGNFSDLGYLPFWSLPCSEAMFHGMDDPMQWRVGVLHC